MTGAGIAQILLYAVVLMALGYPLGRYMARVYEGRAKVAQKVLGPFERLIYRVCGVDPEDEMTWKRYAVGVMLFTTFGVLLVYLLQRLQTHFPLNPNGIAPVDNHVALNTAVSFNTNTNWQAYGGETTMSHLTQMLALTTQNFVSAAVGLAVLVALVRGFVRKQVDKIGNFWVDLTRSTLYILMPLSLVVAVILVSQGVPQTTSGKDTVHLMEPSVGSDGTVTPDQDIAVGPVASQVAIEQLGTNGGGYFNVNSAHPLENPSPLSNFVEDISILLISCACCFMFGAMVGRSRQGIAFLATMWILLLPVVGVTLYEEQKGNPVLTDHGADQIASDTQSGGNMEGKEVRYGISASALWATTTTAASNGSVNSMHDSYTPIGGLGPIYLMGLGEVAFGGVGSGLYGLILFAVVAVFISGLMVGRTPEFLGKKIEAYEMKMASVGILAPAMVTLLGVAIAVLVHETAGALPNPGAHGFSEILYAFTSQSNNNGSAFAGATASGPWWATVGSLCMWIGRYWVIVPTLAIAGSLAKKKIVPASVGTLPTEGGLFITMLVFVVILVGVLVLVPAFALGPVAEHLQLHP